MYEGTLPDLIHILNLLTGIQLLAASSSTVTFRKAQHLLTLSLSQPLSTPALSWILSSRKVVALVAIFFTAHHYRHYGGLLIFIPFFILIVSIGVFHRYILD